MTRKEHKMRALRNEYEKKRLSNPEAYKKHIVSVMKWRKANPEKVSAAGKAFYRREKHLVLTHYGGKCQCCGEDREEFLCLDHINNDGAAHRREIGSSLRSLAHWAKKNGFPNFLQILCYNCNCAKAFAGYCPHEKEKNLSIVRQA